MTPIDPRTRIITVLLISSAAVAVKGIMPLFSLLLLTLLLCRCFSVSLSGSLKRLKKLICFFFLLALLQSVFTSGGEVLIGAGKLKLLTAEGLRTGISIILRMSVIICSALLIASAPALDTVYGLIAMKLPYEIAFMVLLSIKFLPIFKEEFSDSITAVRLSGAELDRIPLKQKLSLYAYILTPVVAKALHRARYISLSMECRGFRSKTSRTSYLKLRMSKADYLGLFAAAAAVMLIIAMNFNIIN